MQTLDEMVPCSGVGMLWYSLVQKDAEHPGGMLNIPRGCWAPCSDVKHPRGMLSTSEVTPSQRRPLGSEQATFPIVCMGKGWVRAARGLCSTACPRAGAGVWRGLFSLSLR